jgi:hypothetical protein
MRCNRNHYTLLVGLQISTTIVVENSMEIPQKLKIELPYDPLILLLGIYLKEHKSWYNGHTCTPMFIAALTDNSQAMETIRIP